MKITLIKGIGLSTEQELNKIGIYSLEDIHNMDKREFVIKTKNIPVGKILKILQYFKVQNVSEKNIEKIRINYEKEQNINKNDKFIGMEIYTSYQDTEKSKIIKYHISHDLYEVGNPNKSYGNSLYNKDQLITLINMQDKFKKEVENHLIRKKEEEIKEKQKLEKENELKRIDKEVYLLDEFTKDMSNITRGKVLQQLNKEFRYDGRIQIWKEVIYNKIMKQNGFANFYIKEYSDKKINLTYKKLEKPVTIYFIEFKEDNFNYSLDINKTQYDYAIFLMKKVN